MEYQKKKWSLPPSRTPLGVGKLHFFFFLSNSIFLLNTSIISNQNQKKSYTSTFEAISMVEFQRSWSLYNFGGLDVALIVYTPRYFFLFFFLMFFYGLKNCCKFKPLFSKNIYFLASIFN